MFKPARLRYAAYTLSRDMICIASQWREKSLDSVLTDGRPTIIFSFSVSNGDEHATGRLIVLSALCFDKCRGQLMMYRSGVMTAMQAFYRHASQQSSSR